MDMRFKETPPTDEARLAAERAARVAEEMRREDTAHTRFFQGALVWAPIGLFCWAVLYLLVRGIVS